MTELEPILLVGGDDRSMLATARSLARRGVPFLILGVGPRSMVGRSRVVRSRALGPMPDARSEPEAFVGAVREAALSHGVRLVLPTTDRTIYACVRRRDAFEPEIRVAAPPTPAVLNVLDKKLNLETAERLGIPCPRSFDLERIDQVPRMIADLGFPMVLKKPGPAAVGGEPRRLGFRWLVAHDESELRSILRDRCPAGVFPVVQQLVTGRVRNVCCFAIDGEIVACHEYASLRRRGGVSVYRELTPLTPELRLYAAAMLNELRWTGVAHLGFFVSPSDGDVRYMETNGRFWASLSASVAAGWDFPFWMYDYFATGRRPETRSQSAGVGSRSRWLFGDLAVLLSRLAGTRDTQSGVASGRIRAVLDYLAGFSPSVDADAFELNDPFPELVEHWHGARLALSARRNRDRVPR